MSQAELFATETTMHGIVRFHGPDVNEQDAVRLTGLLGRVAYFIQTSEWVTLAAISKAAGGSEPSVSARLRQLRNDYRWTIERKRSNKPGVWLYRGRP